MLLFLLSSIIALNFDANIAIRMEIKMESMESKHAHEDKAELWTPLLTHRYTE